MRVGTLDGQEFYQFGDSATRNSLVAIKWRRKNANAVELALFGDVSQVKRVNVVRLRNTVKVIAGYNAWKMCHSNGFSGSATTEGNSVRIRQSRVSRGAEINDRFGV